MKIAIIGTGIAGMSAAYLLNSKHDITVYEKSDRIGGHSRTITIKDDDRDVPVDTGFIVFNHRNYPLLTGLFKNLDVPIAASEMSFGASIQSGWLEYGSKGMFAQPANLVRPQFWTMLRDVLRFNRNALGFIEGRDDMTLGQCLDGMRLGDWFRRYYLQAMGAAIWSCSVETILDFPARTFLLFFENHGLLTVNRQPQWYTVTGGSREYIARLTAGFRDRIRINCGARRVLRDAIGVTVEDERGGKERFDQVVFACHADQTLRVLDAPRADERAILGAFRYQENRIVVHGDASFMPVRKSCWSSWVYLSEGTKDTNPVVSLSYWMNRLQNLETRNPVIITLNPGRRPREGTVQDEHVFEHPVFTLQALRAQEKIPDIQGVDRTWHCGAYQRYGFHEDGLLSAVAVARRLGVEPPWL